MNLARIAETLSLKRTEILKIAAKHLKSADRAERLTCLCCVSLVILGECVVTKHLQLLPALAAVPPTFMALIYSLRHATKSKRKFRMVSEKRMKLDSLVRKISVHTQVMAHLSLQAPIAMNLETTVLLAKLSPPKAVPAKTVPKTPNILHLFGIGGFPHNEKTRITAPRSNASLGQNHHSEESIV